MYLIFSFSLSFLFKNNVTKNKTYYSERRKQIILELQAIINPENIDKDFPKKQGFANLLNPIFKLTLLLTILI